MELRAKKLVLRSLEPSKVQFCMICLGTRDKCKLHPANTYNLHLEFEHFTGISLQDEMHFVPQFCTECAQRLTNCSKFRDKCLRAYQLLLGLVEKNEPLTTMNIEALSLSNNLTSSLAKKSFPPDHCDLHLIHQEQETQQKPNNTTIKIEIECIVQKCEPKTENLDETHNNVEYLEFDEDITYDDIDVDMDDDITYSDDNDNLHMSKDVKNNKDNAIFLKESDISDLESESESEEDIKNIRVPRIYTKRKMRLIKESKLKPKPKTRTNKRRPKEIPELLTQFKITKLSHEEQLADLQKRKDMESFKKCPYKCMDCGKGFRGVDVYNTHRERHTDKFGNLACPVCGLRFSKQYKVNHHISYVHSTLYSCNNCPMVTNHKTVAIDHHNMHKGVSYTCPHCPEKLRSKTGYFSHLRIAHPTDVVCVHCGFSFINHKGLVQHLRWKHRGDDVHSPAGPMCEECNIRFASEAAYHQHRQVSPKHATGESLKRNAPKQVYNSDAKPSRVEDKTKPQVKREPKSIKLLTCEQCGLQVTGYKSYYNHFRSSHPGETRTQYPATSTRCLCELCGRAFLTRFTLDAHMAKHESKKPFECDLCHKTYYIKHQLRMHMKLHTEEHPVYACPICQREFFSKPNRDRHVWTHRKVKPYKCSTCSKTFVDPSTLRAHVQHAHLKKPYPKKNREYRVRASRRRDAKEPVCGTVWMQPEQATSDVAEFPD